MSSKSKFIILSLPIRDLTPWIQNDLQTHSLLHSCKGHLKYKKRNLLENFNLFKTDPLLS